MLQRERADQPALTENPDRMREIFMEEAKRTPWSTQHPPYPQGEQD